MIVYREFESKEKTMQETIREIVIRYFIENSCILIQPELESTQLGIDNSIIN